MMMSAHRDRRWHAAQGGQRCNSVTPASPPALSALLPGGLQNPWLPSGWRLIANPRLEFPLTPLKTSQLQISNRQYPAIFSSASSRHPRIEAIAPLLASSFQPLASSFQRLAFSLQKLIVTPVLEIRATRTKQDSSSFSNRYKMRFLRAPWRAPLLRPGSFSYNPGSHPPEVNQL
jgi:hypothetical protein